MALHIDSSGQGPDLVMLHGWGLHGGLFAGIAPALEAHFRLHRVDLPGHGRSPADASLNDLNTLADTLSEQLPDNAIWLGWSLGGRIALAATASKRPPRKLVLVGTTPCFCQRPDWPHGMTEAAFRQFSEDLKQDYRRTLQRFIALQSRGSSMAREELRALREALFAHGEADPRALAQGLSLLNDVDLRAQLATIPTPTLVLHGSRDTLTPRAAAEYLARQLPSAQLALIEGAGHAPFISHPETFLQALLNWHQDEQ